jgi:hypothetical protein
MKVAKQIIAGAGPDVQSAAEGPTDLARMLTQARLMMILPFAQPASVARNPPSQLGQRAEVISLPGAPGRAISAATAADLSDWLFFLALACCSLCPLARYR